MKKQLLILFLCVHATCIMAQWGTIISFGTIPSSPTTADYVKVFANCEFGSGGCVVSNQGHSTIGSVSNGFALHCLGMLSFICSATDTFNLGYLPAGTNSFFLSLSTGSAPAPCTPGIVADDTSTYYFNVGAATGNLELGIRNYELEIAPNPTERELRIADFGVRIEGIKITNVLGETVYQSAITTSQSEISMDVSALAKGLYFVEVAGDGGVKRGKFIRS